MPRSIEQGFIDFHNKIKTSVAETNDAKSHRASIEQCLKSNFGLNRFVKIGSFGNGTNISGYSDTDYLACLPTGSLTATSTASLVKVRKAFRFSIPKYWCECQFACSGLSIWDQKIRNYRSCHSRLHKGCKRF